MKTLMSLKPLMSLKEKKNTHKDPKCLKKQQATVIISIQTAKSRHTKPTESIGALGLDSLMPIVYLPRTK